jgi:hypothetical protein
MTPVNWRLITQPERTNLMPKRFLGLLMLLFLLSLPAGIAAAQGAPDQINIALDRLSAVVNRTLTINDLQNWTWAQDLYPDLSLGCPQPDTAYAQVATQGYSFLLTYGGVIYDYRVSADGNVAFLCNQISEADLANATPTPVGEDVVDTAIGCPEPEPGVIYLPRRLTSGIQAQVAAGAPIVQRAEPTDNGAVAGEIAAGAIINLVSGPVCADAQVWWQADYDGRVGWVVEGSDNSYALEPVPALSLPANLPVLSVENVAQAAEMSRAEGNIIPALDTAPNSNTVAVLGGTGTTGVWLYDLAALDAAPRLLRGTTQLTDVDYGSDSSLILLGDAGGGIRLWSTDQTSALVERWFDLGYESMTSAVALSPDGGTAASAGDVAVTGVDIDKNNALLLWDIATVAQEFALGGHTGPVNALKFSPDGTLLATASDDTSVRLWNPADGSSVAVLEGHTAPVMALAFSPDGTRLASGSSDGQIILWDAATRAQISTPQEIGPAVLALAYSPDGTLLASAGGDDMTQNYGITLWDAESGEALITLAGHSDAVGDVVFSSSGAVLISASEDKSLRFWGIGVG